jgi:hypothetical protein
LLDAYYALEKENRERRLYPAHKRNEEVSKIRQYLLGEDKNEKYNKRVFKTLIALISDIQNAQRRLIDLAKELEDGNGEANDKGNTKRTNKKLDQERDKAKVSKIRSFLDNSNTNDKNASVQKDHSLSVNKKGYILGFAEKQ